MKNIAIYLIFILIFLSDLVTATKAQVLMNPISQTEAIIKRIDIEGNSYFNTSRIKSELTLREPHWYTIIKKKERLTNRVLEYQKGLIDSLYHINGFLSVNTSISVKRLSNPKYAEIKIAINEGTQTIIRKVEFSGGVSKLKDQTAEKIKLIKVGKPYNHMSIAEITYEIRNLYQKYGYAYCKVNTSVEVSPDKRSADILVRIIPGVKTTFGLISIKGLKYTQNYIASRELLFKTGDIYNNEKILDSHRRLYSSGLFSFVSISPHYYPKTQAPPDITVRLHERKPNYFTIKTGAGQDEQRDFTLDASALYGNRNLFGSGRKFGVSAVSSFEILGKGNKLFNFKNEFSVSYTEPWIMFTRMPLEVQFTYAPNTQSATQDYVYDDYSVAFALSKELSRYSELRLTENFESINIRNIPTDQQEAFRESKQIKLRRKFIADLKKDRRNNLLVPTNGYLTQFHFEYVGGIQGGDVNFVKFGISWSRYQLFKRENVFASRLQINWLREFGSTKIVPIEDRFFMGGASSIRGYRENRLGPKFTSDNPDSLALKGYPQGGKFSLLANIEIRRSLFWRFGGTIFTDIGNLWEKPEDFRVEDLRLTAGVGIQFFTPIGPIRADYATRIIRADDPPGGQYHFGILYIF